MIRRGEVGLIFAELGRESGFFSNEIYAGMVIVIALTTILPPFVMKWFYGRYGQDLRRHNYEAVSLEQKQNPMARLRCTRRC